MCHKYKRTVTSKTKPCCLTFVADILDVTLDSCHFQGSYRLQAMRVSFTYEELHLFLCHYSATAGTEFHVNNNVALQFIKETPELNFANERVCAASTRWCKQPSFIHTRVPNVVLKRLKRVKNKRELAVKGLHFPFGTSWSVPPNVLAAFVFVQRVFLPGGTILVSSCAAQPGDAVF